MKKRKIIGFLLSISLCINSCLIVQAEDYVGPEYDENGFVLSPAELNADKPESTYYEDLEKALVEEEPDTATESDIEYHSEDEPPTDINVTITSYPSTYKLPENNNHVTTFYCYKKETPIHFSKFAICGSLFSPSLPLLLHILEITL